MFYLTAMLAPGAWANSTLPSTNSLNYQGRILKSDGRPLEFNNVSFIFEITSPNGNCVIYREEKNSYNMTNSGGVFDVAIGSGVRQYPSSGSSQVTDYFDNTKTYNCGDTANADTGSTYGASVGEGRKLRVSFWDGSGWQTISPDIEIRAVPYASQATNAEKIGNIPAANVAKKSDLPNTNCSSNEVLTFVNGAFSCVLDQLGASGGGIMNFNGEEGSTQGLAVSATGSLLEWSSASNIHTLKIPLASTGGVSAGLLSNSDYVAFSGKQNSLGFTPLSPANNLSELTNAATARTNLGLSTAGGDLSGTLPNPSIAKLQGKNVTLSSLADKDVLSYDGSQWINKQLSASDITGLTTNLSGKVPYSALLSCSANQTLTYISVVDGFSCANITLDASRITSGVIHNDRLPASAKYWETATGGINYAGGKVGIGATTPGGTLDIQSSDISASPVLNINGAGSSGTLVSVNNNGDPVFVVAGGTDNQVGIRGLPVTYGDARSNLTVRDRSPLAAGIGGGITFGGTYRSDGTMTYWAGISSVKENATDNDHAGSLILHTRTSISPPTERMRITSAGRVGIGTTSPSYKLDVVGDIHASGNVIAGSTTLTSDIRFKKNITSVTNSLDKILSLQGVTYDWRREEFPERQFNDRHQMGVIAQEVEKQFPEAVLTGPDGYKSVNYSSLVAPLINAVRELYLKWSSQDEELKIIKAENNALKKWICEKDPTADFCLTNLRLPSSE